MSKKYNVLSLCDGISTGMVALKAAGIKVGYYAASEIDKYTIQASKANYPGIFQLGNIHNVDVDKIPFDIDLVFMGFPCQGFSFAGKQLNFNDPRSQLFFTGLKILARCKEYNPNVKFLFENVRMRAECEKIITTMLGVKPIKIDSALVCAQTRKRLYWTNISGVEQPEDRQIFLQDILEEDVDIKYYLSDTILARINTDEVRKTLYQLKLEREKSRAILSSVGRTTDREYFTKNQGQLVEVVANINKSQDGKDFAVSGKSQCLSAGHNNTPKVAIAGAIRGRYNEDGIVEQQVELKDGGKSNALTTVEKDNVVVQINPSKEFGGRPRNQHRKYDADYKSPALTSSKGHTTNVAIGVDDSNGHIRTLKDKSLNIDSNYFKGLDNHAQRTHVASLIADCNKRGGLKSKHNKASCVTGGGHSGGNHSHMDVLLMEQDIVVHNLQPRQGKGQGGKGHLMRYPGNKAYCLDTASGQAIERDLIIRRLTPTECHRLQGMPDGYLSMLSDSQQYKALGNGWQKDTIQHILSYLPNELL